MSIHESQSKIWENHVGRSRAFAGLLAAELRVDATDLHAFLGTVRRSPIRVSADEVTYPLHIVLRFELERALIEGALDPGDLAEAFADGLREIVGVTPADPREGVLQDIHWAVGEFGYFPSYALGCVIAAQLWARLDADVGGAEALIATGDFAPLKDWLREHVHRPGRRLDTEDLVASATGSALDVGPFLRHLGARVQPLG
jgi:carboxypeptidase Taq